MLYKKCILVSESFSSALIMRTLLALLLLLQPASLFSQADTLFYINRADSTYYFDKENNKYVYPKLGISQVGRDSVFYKGDLVFYKKPSEKDRDYFLEVFTDSVLIINFWREQDRGVSDPMLIKRNCLRIINLRQPGKVYYVDVERSQIADTKEVYDMFKNAGGEMTIIEKIDFAGNQIILRNSIKGFGKFNFIAESKCVL
mgnify:CR=1 FL=1